VARRKSRTKAIGESEGAKPAPLGPRVAHLESEVAYLREQVDILHTMYVEAEFGPEILQSSREIEQELGISDEQKTAQVPPKDAGRVSRANRKGYARRLLRFWPDSLW
jgi:hypothetical protein